MAAFPYRWSSPWLIFLSLYLNLAQGHVQLGQNCKGMTGRNGWDLSGEDPSLRDARPIGEGLLQVDINVLTKMAAALLRRLHPLCFSQSYGAVPTPAVSVNVRLSGYG